MAVDDLYVYWTDLEGRSVNRMPLSGGDAVVLASNQEYPGWLAAEGQSIYWANTINHQTGQPTGYIMRVARDGGVPTVVASQPAVIFTFALDSQAIYWASGLLTAGAVGSGSISRAPLDAAEPASVLVSGLDGVGYVALDKKYVYWRDSRGVVRLAR